jgi:hypothetical protein
VASACLHDGPVAVFGSAALGQQSGPSLSALEGSGGPASWPDEEAASVFPGLDIRDSEDGDWFNPFIDLAPRVSSRLILPMLVS